MDQGGLEKANPFLAAGPVVRIHLPPAGSQMRTGLMLPANESNHRSPAGSITKHNRVLYDPGSGCRIESPIALLDPPRADMALHRDADMVWAIVGTCCVKFLSGLAGALRMPPSGMDY